MNNSAAAIATTVRRAITGPLWGVFGLTVSSSGPPLAFVSFAVLIAVDPLVVVRARPASFVAWGFRSATNDAGRSEEHTSELQSRGHLVCRLLLEKKKKGIRATRN